MTQIKLSMDLLMQGGEVPAETEEPSSPATPNAFEALGLAEPLVRAVADLGFTQPTPVQNKAIPAALQRQGEQFTDLMVSSRTGSGKTAAFLLPVLHTLLQQQPTGEAAPKNTHGKRGRMGGGRHFKPATPGALVLCPTRELAQQVAHDAIDLLRHCRGMRVATVVGGLPYAQQIAKLQGAGLVVATPGRLLDLHGSGQLKLEQVQFLVIDEADRMLDLGFADALAEINQLTAARQQTMMFSATFAPRIMDLASRAMRNPQRIAIDSPQDKHTNITQTLHWADSPVHRRKLLDHWLRDTTIEQAIVFASTQIECDGLAQDLADQGFSAIALHGALSQGMRNRRLMMVREGRIQILVATDVAARGLDVPTITHVINYGLPMKAEDYTHRIGRTGRAGRKGQAITIAEFRDRRRIFEIEQYTRQQFKASVVPGLEPKAREPHPARRGPPANANGRRSGGWANGNSRGGASGWGSGGGGGGHAGARGQKTERWGAAPSTAGASNGAPGGGGRGRSTGATAEGRGFVPRDAKKRSYR